MRHKENIYMIVTITLYYQVNNSRLMFVSRQFICRSICLIMYLLHVVCPFAYLTQ